MSKTVIRSVISNYGKKLHSQLWSEATEYRQSKLVLPDTQHRWLKLSKTTVKNDLRILTQLVTGHANLRRHRYIMKLEDDPYCSMCGEEQTAIHILTTCPGLVGLRLTILGKPVYNTNEVRNLRVGKILKFAKSTGLWNTGNQSGMTDTDV